MTDLPALFAVESPLERADAALLSLKLKALANPQRLRILSVIVSQDEMTVLDITEWTPLTQPTVSHHLALLEEAGFLTREKRGVFVYYRLAPEALRALAGALTPPKRRRR